MRFLKLLLLSCFVLISLPENAKAELIPVPKPARLSCGIKRYGGGRFGVALYYGRDLFSGRLPLYKSGGLYNEAQNRLRLEKCEDLVERAKSAGSVTIDTEKSFCESGFFIFPEAPKCEVRPPNDIVKRVEELEKLVADLSARLNTGAERVEQLEKFSTETNARLSELEAENKESIPGEIATEWPSQLMARP